VLELLEGAKAAALRHGDVRRFNQLEAFKAAIMSAPPGPGRAPADPAAEAAAEESMSPAARRIARQCGVSATDFAAHRAKLRAEAGR
jgi:hypothetical protein